MARCADGHVRAEETRAADALSGRALPPFARRAHQRSRARHRSSSLAQSSPATSHARRPGCLQARHLACEPLLALDRQSAQNQPEMSSPTPRPLATSIANGVTESSPVQPQIMRNRLDLLTLLLSTLEAHCYNAHVGGPSFAGGPPKRLLEGLLDALAPELARKSSTRRVRRERRRKIP